MSLPFAISFEPELPPDPVGQRSPASSRGTASPAGKRDQPSRVTVVDLEGGRGLHDQARGGEHGVLDEPRLELPLPKQLAGESRSSARGRSRAPPRSRASERSARRRGPGAVSVKRREPFGARTTILFPVAYGSEPSQTLPRITGGGPSTSAVRKAIRRAFALRPLRPERPFADVSADVGQPERAPAGGDHAGDTAAGARADEAVARNPLVAAGGDVPEPDLVAALPVFVRVGDLGARDARGRDRPGHRPLARRRRGCSRNERENQNEQEKPPHAQKLARAC